MDLRLEYFDLSSTVKKKTADMEDIDVKQILNKARPEIIKEVNPDRICLCLIQCQVMNLTEQAGLNETHSRHERMDKLLRLINHKGPKAYHQFVRALEEGQHFSVAYRLSKEEKELVISKQGERKNEIERLEKRLAVEKEKIANLKEEHAENSKKLKDKLDQSRRKVKDERQEHETTREELEKCEEKLAKSRKNAEELEEINKQETRARIDVEHKRNQLRKNFEMEQKQLEETRRELKEMEKSHKEIARKHRTVELERDQSKKSLEEEQKQHKKTLQKLEELEKSHKEVTSVRETVELELDQSRKYLEEERKRHEKTLRELEARSEKGKLDESTRVARLENIRRNNLAKLKSQRADDQKSYITETMPCRAEEPANSSRTRNIDLNELRECLQSVGEMDQVGTTMEPRVDEPPRRQQNTGSNEPLKKMQNLEMEEAALKRAIEKSILEYIAGHENLVVLKEMTEIIVRKVKEEFSGAS